MFIKTKPLFFFISGLPKRHDDNLRSKLLLYFVFHLVVLLSNLTYETTVDINYFVAFLRQMVSTKIRAFL